MNDLTAPEKDKIDVSTEVREPRYEASLISSDKKIIAEKEFFALQDEVNRSFNDYHGYECQLQFGV